MNIQVATFYTVGNGYDLEVENLRKSSQRLEVDLYAEALRPFKNWHEAVCHKPVFILQCLERFKEKDGILWVDADARFRMYPRWKIFDGCHVAFHKFKRSINHDLEYLTGTLFFANTPTVKEFVAEWVDATAPFRHTDTPEQRSLKALVGKWEEKLTVLDLPPEWVWIVDDFVGVYGVREPVIEHHQASRRLRR